MKHYPCLNCTMTPPCDDCGAIKRAEDRQRAEIAAIYAGRRTRSWLARSRKLGALRLFLRGHNLGKTGVVTYEPDLWDEEEARKLEE